MSSTGFRDTTKRDRTPGWQWVQRQIRRAYTSEEWIDIFKSLPPDKQIDALLRTNPVPRELKVDNNSTFQLVISGLQTKVIDSKEVKHKALDEHDPDGD